MTTKKPTRDQIKAEDTAQEITGAEELDDADLDDAAGGRFLTVDARNLNTSRTFNTADSFMTADVFNTADSFNTAGNLSRFDKLKR